MKRNSEIFNGPPRWLLPALFACCVLAAFFGAIVGTGLLQHARAQVAPLGNGGPSVGCADTTLLCTGGYNVQLNLGNANTWTVAQTFPNLFDTGLAINSNVCTDGSSQLTTTGCTSGGVTLAGNNVWTNYNVFNFSPSAACATNAPIAPVCIGSPTSTIGLAIGKISGGWGGTTASNSAQVCFVRNNGTTDSTACDSYSSGGTYSVGSGVAGVISMGGNTTMGSGNTLTVNSLLQNAANNTGGKCTAAANTCTVTLGHSYTTPICFGVDQTTAAPVKATASGTTLTLTNASPGGATDALAGFCLGDPS